MPTAAAAGLSALGFAALLAYAYGAPLTCGGRCFVDPVALHGAALGHISLADMRLNAWILDHVQHALLHDPRGLLDAGAFHPVRHVLTQSEHLLGVALPLLPLRPLVPDAVALHQLATLASAVLLFATTWALVRWLTASHAAAFAAAAAAAFMPWRLAEMSHLQLLSVQWFPLVWLGIGRVVEGAHRPRDLALLGAALALQLLSSFYLAYFLLLSVAALLLGLRLSRRFAPGTRRALLVAGLPALALLLASALPYLLWSQEQGFRPIAQLFDAVPPSDALWLLSPSLRGAWTTLPVPVHYGVPLGVLALAACAPGLGARSAPPARAERQRGFAWGLALACLAAFVLMLGRRLAIDGSTLPLPGALAAAVVPGFSMLRNPLRFAIVIGVAMPVLAGLGFAWIERRARSTAARAALAAALLAGLLASLPLLRVEARDAWQDAPAALHDALAALPEGPLLALPWPLQTEHDIERASRVLLGSTRHRHRVLNGYSGYLPPAYPLLRQVAAGLPDPEALQRLRALVDVRWLVVDMEALSAPDRRAWQAVGPAQGLEPVLARDGTRVFEVLDWHRDAPLQEAVAAGPRPDVTLAGLPRAPLDADARRGRLELALPRVLHVAGLRRLPKLVTGRVVNAGPRDWPGLDPDPQGLVMLELRFLRDGRIVLEERVPLAVDVPAGGERRVFVPLTPPLAPGLYRLHARLVQRVGEDVVALDAPPVEADVAVRATAL